MHVVRFEGHGARFEVNMQCQFELWEECNSRCKFCYLGNNNVRTEDKVKLQNMDKVIEVISKP